MASGKHQPVRMCVFCRKRLPKSKMLRFALKDGVVTADLRGRLAGRGAYCCFDERCMAKAQQDKRGFLKRALRAA